MNSAYSCAKLFSSLPCFIRLVSLFGPHLLGVAIGTSVTMKRVVTAVGSLFLKKRIRRFDYHFFLYAAMVSIDALPWKSVRFVAGC